jgi:hypothetical protein
MPMRAAKCPRDILLGLLHPAPPPSRPPPPSHPAISTAAARIQPRPRRQHRSHPARRVLRLPRQPQVLAPVCHSYLFRPLSASVSRSSVTEQSRAAQRSSPRSARGCTPICAPLTVSESSVVIVLALSSSPRVCVQWFGWGWGEGLRPWPDSSPLIAGVEPRWIIPGTCEFSGR